MTNNWVPLDSNRVVHPLTVVPAARTRRPESAVFGRDGLPQDRNESRACRRRRDCEPNWQAVEPRASRDWRPLRNYTESISHALRIASQGRVTAHLLIPGF